MLEANKSIFASQKKYPAGFPDCLLPGRKIAIILSPVCHHFCFEKELRRGNPDAHRTRTPPAYVRPLVVGKPPVTAPSPTTHSREHTYRPTVALDPSDPFDDLYPLAANSL